MILTLSEASQEPLHRQLSRQIRAKILAHDIEGGASLPSIRALAREQRVSVITVQRAYDDLEREGLVRSRPGKGFYVMSIPEGRLQDIAEERFRRSLAAIVSRAAAEGLEPERIRRLFEELLGDGRRGV